MINNSANENGPEGNRPAEFKLPQHWDNQVSPTKGETYPKVHNWAVDVTVPDDWDEQKDKEYFDKSSLSGISREDIPNYIIAQFEAYQGSLTYAFCYLTGQPYDLEESMFHYLPIRAKVEVLWALFRKRNSDAFYLETFEVGLRPFLDVARICVPVLQRYLLNPDSVLLREVADAFESILGAHVAFTESMAGEHEDCPAFNYGRIESRPQPPDPNPPGDDPLQGRLQPDLPLTA